METRLQVRGIHPSRIRVIPNVGIEGEIVPLPRHPNAFREKHNLQESFIVMYSGNMGRAHEFGTVLEAARIFQEEGDEGIAFLFVGHGPMEPELRAEVTRLQLGNVLFIPNQRLEDLSVSLGAADVHLVTMQSGMEGLVVPSKFYGVLAAERPCLFVGSEDSEVARVILEYGLGWVIRPGQAAQLATAIGYAKRTLHDKEIPVRGRDYLRRQNARDEFIRCTDQLREEIFFARSR
jgi:glycosyltransferase involved in cell wall biosynthesis